jgi:protein-S-isoprenylcysteine O-methyltransferase Ste14
MPVLAEALLLFATVALQQASFTLVSRARNSNSLVFHGLAATAGNGIYLLVLRQVVTHLDSLALMAIYLVAAVLGSVTMHHVSMRYLERRLRQDLGGEEKV